MQIGPNGLRTQWLSLCPGAVCPESLSASTRDVTGSWSMSGASLPVSRRLPLPDADFQSYTSSWRSQSGVLVGFSFKIHHGILE